jgi:hypothetical protein
LRCINAVHSSPHLESSIVSDTHCRLNGGLIVQVKLVKDDRRHSLRIESMSFAILDFSAPA